MDKDKEKLKEIIEKINNDKEVTKEEELLFLKFLNNGAKELESLVDNLKVAEENN